MCIRDRGNTVAEKVRAHGDHDINRQRFPGRAQQQSDQAVRFVGVLLAVAENLLELVHHQQQRFADEMLRLLAVQVAERQRAGAEDRRERRDGGGAVGVVGPAGIFGERAREVGERRIACLLYTSRCV